MMTVININFTSVSTLGRAEVLNRHVKYVVLHLRQRNEAAQHFLRSLSTEYMDIFLRELYRFKHFIQTQLL